MFFIPGQLISLVTFPGVIVHELAHQLFCRLYKVPVFEVVHFRFGNPCGYVIHERVNNKWQGIMISVGPFIVNTLIAAIIALPASLPVFKFNTGGPLDYFLIYLSVSIAMHAFPSTGDANSIWNALKEKDTPIWARIVGYPIVCIIYVGSFGSMVWLDLLYGIGVAIGIPNLIIGLLS
jgi:nitrate reductase NapE component